ncbi:MAG TPA: VWA domain-containing protein [Streptosporangiaceae bacterium]|nr:VWA domain-containing protein [Streptosporangiaceae bacterium]
MQALLAGLVDELRAVGIAVSVGEHLDAARALSCIALGDKEVVRTTLQCTLVKRSEHVSTFNLLFDLYTSGRPLRDSPLADLSDAELRAMARQVVGSDDAFLRRLVADEYVRRFSGLAPGDAVAGVFATIAVNEAADLAGLRADLLAAGADDAAAGDGSGDSGDSGCGYGGSGGGSGGGGGSMGGGGGGGSGGSGSSRAAGWSDLDRAIEGFRADLASAVRRALVADRGARAVRATMRVGLAENADIASASAADREAMATAIAPLAQRLTKIMAQQARDRKRKLSIRRTVQRAMGTGGIPFRLATEPLPPPRPDIVVLADMSGSVSTFSRFTLDLLVALDSRLSRLRVFSFVDGVAEITGLVREARFLGRQITTAEAARDAIRFGGSDYGYVMREFAAEYADQLSRRSVLLVVGDARTNYLDPAEYEFAAIRQRVGQLYWLNPEQRRFWDTGDSVMSRYARWCDRVQECRTLRQIADFVQDLSSQSRR